MCDLAKDGIAWLCKNVCHELRQHTVFFCCGCLPCFVDCRPLARLDGLGIDEAQANPLGMRTGGCASVSCRSHIWRQSHATGDVY